MTSADRSEIINVLNLYGYAMASQAWHLFDQIFTRDAHIVFPTLPKPAGQILNNSNAISQRNT
jgi:hypothetical protein